MLSLVMSTMLTRITARRSRLAVSWFVAASIVLAVAGGGSLLLMRVVGATGPRGLSAAFLTSTALLIVVSVELARADRFARRERQRSLRRSLAFALAAAILFLAVQGTALSGLLSQMTPDDAAVGPRVLVFTGTAMHALHAIAAAAWLVFATLRGFAGGYDHEYRFGLTACGWCWHALGIAWIAVLVAFAVAV